MSAAATVIQLCLEVLGAEDAHQQAKRFRSLLDASPKMFFRVACALLRDVKDTPNYRYLLALLNSRGLLVAALRTLATEDPGAAGAATNLALRLIPGLEKTLPRGDADTDAMRMTELESVEYVRGVFDVANGAMQLLALVEGQLARPDDKLRARMALLSGRVARVWERFRSLCEDPDARVRANAVESLWGSSDAYARQLFDMARRDPNHRVRANALVGLYLIGDASSLAGLLEMSAHPEGLVRAAAAWAMGRTGDIRFEGVLQELRRGADHNPIVIRNALLSLARLQRADAARAHLPAQITLLGSERGLDGSLCLHIGVDTGLAEDLVVSPVEIHPYSGHQPVWNYSSRYLEGDARRVILLLPIDGERFEEETVSWSEDLHRAVAGFPAGGSWALGYYLMAPRQRAASRRGEILHLNDDDALQIENEAIVAPPFRGSAVELEQDAGEQTLGSLAQGPFALAVELLKAAEPLPDERIEVVLAVSGLSAALFSARALERFHAALEKSNARLHVASTPDCPPRLVQSLRGLCRTTSGWFAEAKDEKHMRNLAGVFTRSLQRHLVVDLQADDLEDLLALRLRTGRFSAELPLGLDARSLAA